MIGRRYASQLLYEAKNDQIQTKNKNMKNEKIIKNFLI